MIARLVELLNTAAQRRRAAFVRSRPEQYDKEVGRWITIGGADRDGEKHSGGTHVKISPTGHIQAGPDALEGRHVGELSGKRGHGKSSPVRPRPDDKWSLKHPTDKPEGVKHAAGQLFDKSKPVPGWAGGPDRKEEAAPPKHGPPAGVRATPDGRWVGSTVIPAHELQVDSDRFQYKISGIDPTTGTTAELKAVKRYNPDFGGQLLVWRDPQDGKTYVVNGHHRAELAKRSEHWEPDEFGSGWQGDMAVRYLPARSATEARAVGALANIAEGRGTATDAAKFLRDVKGGADQLAQYGVSLRGKVAQDAVVLSKLAPDVFHDMARGIIEESRGLAIARHLDDPDLQSKLNRMVKERERKDGRAVPDAHVAEMSREMSLAGKAKVGGGGGGLFGDDDHEESLVFQRADLKAALRRELTQERNTFKAVSSGQRVKRITGAGSNQLDVDTNKTRAQQADEALFVFDKLANSRGELSDAIQQHAAQLFQQPGKRNKLLASLKARALEILDREGAESSGVPAGGDSAGGAVGRQPATLGFSRTAATGARAYAPARESGAVTSRELVLAFARAFTLDVERYARVRPSAGQRSLLFEEAKHPRDDGGKFASKGAAGSSGGGAAHVATSPPAATPHTSGQSVPATKPATAAMVSQFQAAFNAKALAPATAPLPGQRDLFDPEFNVPLSAPPPRAAKDPLSTSRPEVRDKPVVQTSLFHGLKDLPGQQSLFQGMDLGAARQAITSALNGRSTAEKYAKSEESGERWITIGGAAENDQKHVGGTHVKIDKSGKITAGPDALAGKSLSELPSSGVASKDDAGKTIQESPARTHEKHGNSGVDSSNASAEKSNPPDKSENPDAKTSLSEQLQQAFAAHGKPTAGEGGIHATFRQPAFKGSAKQIAFAADVRNRFLERLQAIASGSGLKDLWHQAHDGKHAPDARWWMDRSRATATEIMHDLENCRFLNTPETTITRDQRVAESQAARELATPSGQGRQVFPIYIPYEHADVREAAKKAGAKWNPDTKKWMLPDREAHAKIEGLLRDKAAKPTTSTAAAPAASSSVDHAAVAAQSGRTVTAGAKPGSYTKHVGNGRRESVAGMQVKVGDVLQRKDGPVIVTRAEPMSFVSGDQIEDNDAWAEYKRGAGWYQSYTAIPVERTTAENAAAVKEEGINKHAAQLRRLETRVRRASNHAPDDAQITGMRKVPVLDGTDAKRLSTEGLYTDGKQVMLAQYVYDDGWHHWISDDPEVVKAVVELADSAAKIQ